ncbi:MAG: hypothetical protein ACOX3K_05260 [Bacilli bacterium]
MRYKIPASLLFLASVTFQVPTFTQADEQPVKEVEPASSFDFEEEYNLDQKIFIPDKTLTVGGVEMEVTPIVYYPSGYALRKNEIQLTEPGKYLVLYEGRKGAEKVREEHELTVKIPLISLDQDKSSYSIGDFTKYRLINGNNEHPKESDFIAEPTGLQLNVGKGDRVKINATIDLKDDSSLCDFYIVPQQLGKADAENIFITFTDLADANNSITINIKLTRSDRYTYFTAKANDQYYAGLEPKYSDGNFDGYKPQVNNIYGRPMLLTNAGLVEKNALQRVRILYDEHEKAIYENVIAANTKICDFDDPSFQTSLWGGFKQPYVKMSIEGAGYKSDSLSLFFTNIKGLELIDGDIVDHEPPNISFETEDPSYLEMPNGKVNQRYYAKKAIANDLICGQNLPVQVKAVKNYIRGSGVYYQPSPHYDFECDVTQGYFVPDRIGEYALVYSASDYFGNYIEYVSTIHILGDIPNHLSLSVVDHPSTTYLNSFTNLGRVASFGGYVTAYRIACRLSQGNRVINADGNYIDGFHFIPDQVGIYQVRLIISDNVGNSHEFVYTLEVLNTDKPTIPHDVQLDKYYLTGFDYHLPVLLDSNHEPCEVYVSDEAGVRPAYHNVANFVGEEAIITYKTGDCEIAKTVKIVRAFAGYELLLTNYFQGNTEAKIDQNAIIISSKNADCDVEFVNKLLTDDFCTVVGVNPSKNDFDRLVIYLEDSVSPSEKVKISLVKSADGVSFYLNDQPTGVPASNIFAGAKTQLTYFNRTNQFSDGLNSGIDLTATVYGEPFQGFSSGKFYVRYGLEGVHSSSSMRIYQINNQFFNTSIVEDRTKPFIKILERNLDLIRQVGDVVTLSKAIYADVLSPIQAATISVSFNDSPIADINGVILHNASCDYNYRILLNDYGKYIVTYMVTDACGRYQGYSYLLNVIDREGPVITTSMTDQTAVVGTVVKVAEASAYDNLDGEVKVDIYVITPDFMSHIITDTQRFAATRVGKYQVIYIAIDSVGNKTTKIFTVTVKESN